MKLEDVAMCADKNPSICGWWGHKSELRPTGMCPVCHGRVRSIEQVTLDRESLDNEVARLELILLAAKNGESWSPKKGTWAEMSVAGTTLPTRAVP
jgi:hypothetical protein